MLRIALPHKGRLAHGCRELLERAGLDFGSTQDRVLHADIHEHLKALFVRARDIPTLVRDGAADLGITGSDLIEESECGLDPVLDLGFGRCRLAVAVRDESPIRSVDDLSQEIRVATSFPNIARSFFESRGRTASIVPISGSVEIAPHLGLAEAIVDLVSTGSTLKLNGLREIETIMTSSAVLVSREEVKDTQGGRELFAAIQSVLDAQEKRYLMANVPKEKLDEVRALLPGISGPTLIDVMNSGHMVATHAVIERSRVYTVIAALKRLGAQGILITKIERLMP